MKTRSVIIGLSALLNYLFPFHGLSAEPLLVSGPVTTDAGPHHRVIQQLRQTLDPAGRPTQLYCSYIQLGSGLNRAEAQGRRWVPARAEFERTGSGHWIARQTQHQLILSPNLTQKNAVDLLTPDGLRLRSTILGLALVDPRTGQSALLAALKPSQPDWIAPNQVLYPDAFDEIAADVRYTLGLDRFEQDIILRQRIPLAFIEAVGLDPRWTRLAVLTEFFDPPKPARRNATQTAPPNASSDQNDLHVGQMRIGLGQAFALQTTAGAAPTSIPVGHNWELLEGRQFLVEYIDLVALEPLMNHLPLPTHARLDTLKARLRRTASARPLPHWPSPLPPTRPTHRTPPHFHNDALVVADPTQDWAAFSQQNPWHTAHFQSHPSSPQTPGVVLDYLIQLTGGWTDYPFKADTTYYITGPVHLYGTTTFEGGTVIKFAPDATAQLLCYGPIDCQTAPYRPALFTAKDDNTAGEIIAGSTGNPSTTYYANPALTVRVGGQRLQYLRFAYAQTALFYHDYSANNPNTLLAHAQFVRCNNAILAHGYGSTAPQYFNLRNVLVHDTATAFSGYNFEGRIEHLTLHQCSLLGTNRSGAGTLYLTNSLLVAVTNSGNLTLYQNSCQWAATSNGVFQTIGAAGFYLARPDWRNAGTTNVSPTLAADLKNLTTYPPVVLTGLLVIVSPPLAAVVGAGYAGLLSLVGLVPIPMPFVVVAGLIGISASIGARRV